MHMPVGWWLWFWRSFARWSRLDLDPLALSSAERWDVVAAVIPAVVRARYARPTRNWFLSRLPAWVALVRLERHTNGWYRIPDRPVAEHCMFRFDHPGLDIGTFLKIARGVLVATGHVEADHCEILFFLPNGEVEDEPDVPEMGRAWQSYWQARASLKAGPPGDA